LETAGYEFREQASVPERLFFRCDYQYNDEMRRVHIHVTEFGRIDWKELVDFRDYLREHRDVVRQYEKLKKEAVMIADGDGEKYRKHKEDFILNVLKKV